MFIRPCHRTKNGRRHAYWALVESYRTDRGPRQRVVAYLGQLPQTERRGVKQAAEGKQKTPYQQLQLFDEEAQPEPEWVEVDTANVRVENEVDFGGPWLAWQLVRILELDKLFDGCMPRGGEHIPWAKMAVVLVICRLCNPSSELHIAEHYYRGTAMSELLGIPAEKVNEQRLYRALDKLLPHKEALEKHLKNRLGRLFGLEYDLLLYDVTSTYFEGESKTNPKAQRGYSRDKRSDCKQICIGLVVSKCGMPLGYEIFAGNHNDVKTWREIVTTMEAWRDWAALSEGCYLLRTNVTDWSAEDLWRAYIQLTEAEAAFRIHKSDLRVRPVWHQKEDRVDAHILVCFLAYVLWKTLHQMTKAAGLGDEPRRIFEELGRISLVDVVLPTREGPEIRRCWPDRCSATSPSTASPSPAPAAARARHDKSAPLFHERTVVQPTAVFLLAIPFLRHRTAAQWGPQWDTIDFASDYVV